MNNDIYYNDVTKHWETAQKLADWKRQLKQVNLKGVQHSRSKPVPKRCSQCHHYSVAYNECTDPKLTKAIRKTHWTNSRTKSYVPIEGRVNTLCILWDRIAYESMEANMDREEGTMWIIEASQKKLDEMEHKIDESHAERPHLFSYGGHWCSLVRVDGLLKVIKLTL